MKLKIYLLLLFLMGIGLFSFSQTPSKKEKPTIENGPDALPVTVKSSRKAKKKAASKPQVEVTKFTPPKIVKDRSVPPPPPPRRKTS
jgi:hypothetical protein